MKTVQKTYTQSKEILANDHYVAIPYDCTSLTPNAEGIVPAGTIVPANDATAIGVLLWDVEVGANPNGTVVVHGFIEKTKLPTAPADTVNLPMIMFMD
jgi:hypothetical protein